jgi:hypothetical protein
MFTKDSGSVRMVRLFGRACPFTVTASLGVVEFWRGWEWAAARGQCGGGSMCSVQQHRAGNVVAEHTLN